MSLPSKQEMEHLLDRVKTAAFLNSNSAFLGSLLCQLKEIVWDEKTDTAATDGVFLYWNPEWFLKIPEPSRKSILLHELWHNGRLHGPRRGNRNPEIWNAACDYVINNNMVEDGYTFDGCGGLFDKRFSGMAEEQVYDILIKEQWTPPLNWKPDIIPSKEPLVDQVASVAMAMQQAIMAGQAGNLPGAVSEHLDKFLKPVVPWQNYLHEWMAERVEQYYTWNKPNRRFSDVYMPSSMLDEGGLEHLAYFIDCSGSVTKRQLLRFNSEVKFIKETYNPEKITLICFDTRIQSIKVLEQDDDFDEVEVVGRGGTSLVCVHDWIDQHRPTAAIIFTDMECHPMDPLKSQTPVLWAISGTHGHKPNFGQSVHVPD